MRVLVILILLFSMWSCSGNRNDATTNNHKIATIKYSFQGCFGGDNSEMVISKQDFKLFATLVRKHTRKTIPLNSEQLKHLTQFFERLRMLPENYGCTTTATYVVSIGSRKFKREDNACELEDFGGFGQYFEQLMPVTQAPPKRVRSLNQKDL